MTRNTRICTHLIALVCAVLALASITAERPTTAVAARLVAVAPSVDRSHWPGTDMPTLQADVAVDWWSAVRAQIEKDAYAVRPLANAAPGTFEADNPAQRWQARFTPNGVTITPMHTPAGDPRARQTRPSADWTVGLRLTAYGAGDVLTPVAAVAPRAEGARVEFEYGDSKQGAPALTEWYANAARGIEHGFTLTLAPAGAGPVTLELAVAGGLQPMLQPDGLAVELRAPDGAIRVRYANLFVTDASGRTLPATLSVPSSEPQRIHLTVDTRGAVYPITIDPLLTEPPTTLTGEAPENFFGVSVATAGDVNADGYADVVVGAPGYSSYTGRVYVYLGGASGLATTAAATLTGGADYDQFGGSVATAGDVNGDGFADMVVGAQGYSNYTGRAYVYLGGASGLATTAATTLTGEVNESFFGISVATAGDVNRDGYADVVVGAQRHNGSTGRGYVYLGGPSGLATTAATTLTGEAIGNEFGYSVATAGDVNGDGYADVVVGAHWYGNSTGRAYVYLGGAGGLAMTAATTLTGEAANDEFGRSVATAGDVNGDGYADIVVGAYWYGIGTGRAYVYLGSATGLATTAATTLTGETFNDFFGASVAPAGDVNGDGYADVVVGAYGYTSGVGRAYLYLGAANGLATTIATTLTGAAGDQFGYSVATAGDVNGDGYADVVVGAPHYNSDTGRVHVYLGGASRLASTAATIQTGAAIFNHFGQSVATVGDVNGDGYADVAVGAPYYADYTGQVYVYLGGPGGLATTAATTLTGAAINDSFGFSVATAGDVNGDGYADVVVGAQSYNNNTGRAYLFLGGASGLATTAATTLTGEATGNSFGGSVATAGDVNGDGYAEVVVAARDYSNATGRVYVFLGGASGLATTAATTLTGGAINDQFGCSVATAGDVNGDGYADVIVGAKGYNAGTGRAFVFLGGASGLVTTAATTLAGEALSNQFGISVATAGDVNGDGYADVVIGAPGYHTGIGRAYVFLGGASGLVTTAPPATLTGAATDDFLGASVATAGDVNGDGYADVVVGAYLYGGGAGRAHVYLGGVSGLATAAATSVAGAATGNYFGSSVATAGDVNGDGYADVVVGAPGYATYTGRAYVYLGNGGLGRSLAPRTRRADNTSPIAYGGRSESTTAFRLAAIGHGPFGRTQVKLEWEVKPLGTSFNGIGTSRSAIWQDTTTVGASLNELASGLTRAKGYHWRVRVRYHSASTPFSQHSRWVTQPWVGAQETRLRTKNLAPTVSQIYPASGSTLGGTVVTINGTGFVQGAAVTLGGVDAGVTVTSATALTVVTGAHAEGAVNVVVTNPDAQAATVGGAFIYVTLRTPVVTWVTPAVITVGTPLSGTQLNATADVPGTFVYTPASGTVLAVGTHTLSTTFTPIDTVYFTTVTKTVDLVVLPPPTLTVLPATLRFTGTNTGGTLNPITPPQTATVTFSSTAAVAWTAAANQTWVQITNGSGTGSGTFRVGIINPNNVLGTATTWSATITVTATGASNSPQTVAVRLTLQPASANQPPFGSFDTPAGGTTGMQGSFAVTGWALDDIGVDHVELWRDLVNGEPADHAYTTDPSHPGYGKVYIANPFFVTGSRTDVEGLYPTYPLANRAGWGYLLLSWGLPNQGNGTYTLHAFAYDVDGHHTLLGTKTIAVANAQATKPFGALDTPGYGATVTGPFWNYGWALTPNASPACTILNGSVTMHIDSGPGVAVNYGDLRTDIAASFAGFSNGTNSGGASYLDTTTLSNGMHTIGWLVYDNCGRGDGIGSRFFTVLNGGARPNEPAGPQEEATGRPGPRVAARASGASADPVRLRHLGGEWQPVSPAADGTHVIELAQDGRIEVQLPQLPGAAYAGVQAIGESRRPLPVGSSLDATAGLFYWQPAPGFLGKYDLVFGPSSGAGAVGGDAVRVRVVVGPAMRAVIDTPQPDTVVAPPFTLAGWALDLAANEGTGVDTVHVWAYPATGTDPIFLGVAAHGDARPDVGAMYGEAFAGAAYGLTVDLLPPGTYDVVVYPHRAKTNTFEGAQVVRVVVK
jgi:hypothetical protein